MWTVPWWSVSPFSQNPLDLTRYPPDILAWHLNTLEVNMLFHNGVNLTVSGAWSARPGPRRIIWAATQGATTRVGFRRPPSPVFLPPWKLHWKRAPQECWELEKSVLDERTFARNLMIMPLDSNSDADRFKNSVWHIQYVVYCARVCRDLRIHDLLRTELSSIIQCVLHAVHWVSRMAL